MRKRNVWLVVLLMGVLGLVAQAEMKVTTAPVNTDYTGGVADSRVESQYPGNVYQTGSATVRANSAGSRIDLAFFRFDLNSVKGRDLTEAVFTHAVAWSTNGQTNRTFDVLGIIDTGTSTAANGDRWATNLLSWTQTITAAPTGLGWVTTGAGTYGYYSMNLTLWQRLGTITFTLPSGTPPVNTMVVSSHATLDMDSFLAADTNKLVTIMIAPTAASNCWYNIQTADTTTDPALLPTLIFPHAYPLGGSNPQPANGSTTTNLNLSQLSWKTFGVAKYKVYFGPADSNELIATVNAAEGSSDASATIPAEMLPLSVPQTYEWFVNGYTYPETDPNHTGEPNVLIPGAIWTFYTSAIPTLFSSPTEQRAFVGGTATFTAVFDSITPLTSTKWYKEMGETDQEMISPKATIMTTADGNRYTSTMTINSIADSDDAEYYCVAGNSGGSATSAAARLLVKRMIAHWAFDGNVNDELNTYNGTLYGEPNFVTDGTRQVLDFDGVSDYVSLPAGFSNFITGLAYAAWVRPTAITLNGRIIELANANGDNLLFYRGGLENTVLFQTFNFGTTNDQQIWLSGGANSLRLNEWQHLVVTVDESRNVIMYRNGLQLATGAMSILPRVITRDLNFIGKSNATGDALYKGQIDDIRVFNYALTADQTAQLYADVAGNFCRTRPTYDYSNNCIVDIADFAIFAAQWLDCGFWPECP